MGFGPISRYRQVVSTNTWTSDKFRDARRLLHLHVTYTSDATVGNRTLELDVINGGNNEWDVHGGASQAASLVRHYSFMPGVYRETSFVGDDIQYPFPEDLILVPGDTLKISDTANVSAGDSMVITYRLEDIS